MSKSDENIKNNLIFIVGYLNFVLMHFYDVQFCFNGNIEF